MRWMLIGVIVAGVVGCSSVPETNFYTFDMNPSGRVNSDIAIRFDRLDTAEALARPDIMILTSPTEVEYYGTHSWVSGLRELVAQKLKNEFSSQPGAKTFLVSGKIIALRQEDTEDGANAHIELYLEVFRINSIRDEKPILQRQYSVTENADSAEPGDVVKALSGALETIAEQFAADLETVKRR